MKKICMSLLSLVMIMNCYAQNSTNINNNESVSYNNDNNNTKANASITHNEFNLESTKKKNFVGIGIGESILNLDNSENDKVQDFKERRKKFWNIYTGHQINDNFSVKAEYVRLIDIKSNQKSLPDFKMRALSFSGLGFYPVTKQASLFGEAGMYLYRAKQSYDDEIKSSQQNQGVKPFVGVGIKYDLGKSDVILKYNNYGRVSNEFYSGKLSQVQFNVEYKF